MVILLLNNNNPDQFKASQNVDYIYVYTFQMIKAYC